MVALVLTAVLEKKGFAGKAAFAVDATTFVTTDETYGSARWAKPSHPDLRRPNLRLQLRANLRASRAAPVRGLRAS